MSPLVARATRKRTLSQVMHVTPVPPRAAQGLVAEVYRQVERDFGMLAPPVSMHSPSPATMAASWLMLRESLIATGTASRATKEAVATGVSLANQCPYCVDVHGAAIVGLMRKPDAEAVAEGRIEQITDPGLRALTRWAREGGGPMPYREALAEHVGVAVTFHYLNRMANLFLPNSPIPSNVPDKVRPRVKRVAAHLMGMLARSQRPQGNALDLLPAAGLPADMAWAAGHRTISGAFSRAAAAIDAAGARAVPEAVRALIHDRLDAGGTGPGLHGGAAWLEEAVTGMSDVDRSAGRLAMVTAFASYRVTPEVITGFRRDHPGDTTFVEFASWVSMAAARHIGARLARSAKWTTAQCGNPKDATTESGVSVSGVDPIRPLESNASERKRI